MAGPPSPANLAGLKSSLTKEKPLNSSWLMLRNTSWLTGVSVGSSLVKSWSKLFTSRLVFCRRGERGGDSPAHHHQPATQRRPLLHTANCSYPCVSMKFLAVLTWRGTCLK